MLREAVLAGGLAVLLIGAGADAGAAPKPGNPVLPRECPNVAPHVAVVKQGSVTRFDVLDEDPDAALAEGDVLGVGSKLLRGPTKGEVVQFAYAVTGSAAATLAFRGNTYRVSPGTFFYIACYRNSANGPALPMLSVRALDERAKVVLDAAGSKPGGLGAGFPGFGHPNRAGTQRVELTIEMAGQPSATWSSNKTLTITPGVGKGAGKCIYPRRARIAFGGKVSILRR